jgi:antitoxin (DNA-binding transcriptional repressor) of toxin-antitoxin stability system
MKRVTASEARRNWFRLLDEVAQGVVVCIERGGRRIVLRRQPESERGADVPDHGTLLGMPKLDEADAGSWSRWEDAGPEPEE